jgi:hypothetical protein
MRRAALRELTYEHDDQVERGRKGGQAKEPAHDLNTCEAPICVETRRIIRARGARQRTPKAWEARR